MAEIRTSSISVGKMGVIEGTFTKQMSYAMHRGYCVVEEEEKGIPLLLRGRRGWGVLTITREQCLKDCGLLL